MRLTQRLKMEIATMNKENKMTKKQMKEILLLQDEVIEQGTEIRRLKAKLKASEITENNAEKHLQLAENALKRKDEEIAINNEDIEHLEHTIATQLETINHKDEQLKVKDIQLETLKQLIKDEMRS